MTILPKRIYISAPISGYDLAEREMFFSGIEEEIRKKGFVPVNPFKNGLPLTASYLEHMAEDIKMLLACDGMMQSKQWRKSKGCTAENNIAKIFCIPVVGTISEQGGLQMLKKGKEIMIDDNAIMKAAHEYNPDKGFDNQLERVAFMDGVAWFRQNLWHADDEIPESGKIILVKGLDWGSTVGCYNLFDTTTDVDLADFDKKIQWENFCENAGVDFLWCYIEDILPKGGEQ